MKLEITEQQKSFLIENLNKMSNEKLGRHLKVSAYKVGCWIKELELNKIRIEHAVKFEPETEYFNASLMDNWIAY